MNWLTRAASIAVLSAVLILGGTTQGRSQPLDVIFIDSLWGAAVGGIAGLSIGLLSENDEDEIFSDYMAKGMGVGALGGLLYGLFHYPPPYYGQRYLNNGQPKGLLHFSTDDNILAISPGKIIPRQEFDKDLEESTWRFDLFSTSFSL
ncbi:MAG: hypothetical protein WGN25_00170 [Candidatus Electrothrix sp. GW3-4]|uniref:hypothetical protein n=1 Tax=Candidatus Electrothrix sp. GW3-4 TaxID=3126740 RepID=UPI0030D59330